MEIVAVAMRDVKAMGVDSFFVRFGPDQVHSFDVFSDGRVVQTSTEYLPERTVTAAIEKFNASYRVVPPVPLKSQTELPSYLGRFVLTSDTQCRLGP